MSLRYLIKTKSIFVNIILIELNRFQIKYKILIAIKNNGKKQKSILDGLNISKIWCKLIYK